ncbi:MAG: hypothetical protein ABEI86_05975 [Halobacteriaceae archaeon]
MPSHDMIPDPEEMHDHLVSTLKEIPNRLGPVGRDLETDSGIIQAKCKSFTERYGDDPDNWELDISPNWVFDLEDGHDFESSQGKAVIGGHIVVEEGEYQEYSFNLSILQKEYGPRDVEMDKAVNGALCCSVDNHDTWTIVRRFHFDIDSGEADHEAKPVSHFQTGGKFPDGHGIPRDIHYCRTELDKPRIQYPPMDLVLVLDMVLDQYTNLSPNRDKHWTNLVSKSERVLWAPYYKEIGSRYIRGDFNDIATDLMKNSNV